MTELGESLPQNQQSTPARRGELLRGALLVLALSLVCLVPLLGRGPLAGTEGHRAITAHQMLAEGNWLLPRLYGRVYLAKPPLHYWIVAGFEKLAGHGDEFVWRLPSALSGALLNVALFLFGARWFGRIGGWIAGFSGLSLITLWGQNRAAEVDALNTLFSALAAMLLVEMLFAPVGQRRRQWAWISGAGLALGATLMVKGPAGLTPVAGVLAWWIIDSFLRGTMRRGFTARAWLPLVMGAAIFGSYLLLAALAMRRQNLPRDVGGLGEAVRTLHPSSLAILWKALSVPFQLFAYALPVSAALPLEFARVFRQQGINRHSPAFRVRRALVASILLSWLICVASGMTNPRYGFVTLPPLCLLAGALAAQAVKLPDPAPRRLRTIALISAAAFLAGQIVLTALLWKHQNFRPAIIAAAMLSVVVFIFTHRGLVVRGSWQAAWGLVAMICLLSIPFALHNWKDREKRSGFDGAEALRSAVGRGTYVVTGGLLRSQPELFYYAGVDAHLYGGQELPDPSRFAGGYWVVLNANEYKSWSRLVPHRLSRITEFHSHKLAGYTAWYSREDNHSPGADTFPGGLP